jgi:hypothetical protein
MRDETPSPPTCPHAVDIGNCTLPDGHDGCHHDETSGAQWFDRSDCGVGVYSSVQPGDTAWRHERGDCPDRPDRCLRCLVAERDALAAELARVGPPSRMSKLRSEVVG